MTNWWQTLTATQKNLLALGSTLALGLVVGFNFHNALTLPDIVASNTARIASLERLIILHMCDERATRTPINLGDVQRCVAELETQLRGIQLNSP